MKDRISFHEQIARNKRNSFLLMFVVIAVFISLAYVVGLIYQEYSFKILIFGIIFSLSYTLFSYYNSDKIALASVNAKPASYQEYRQLHHIVEGLCLASGLEKPKLYIMQGEQINAFATGRNPKNSVVCITEGTLNKLSKQELEGVLGHELSHIANYDIRFMTLVVVLVGMVSIISELFLRSLWFSGGERKSRANAILLLIGILLAILAPVVVMLVQLAISRKREYAADASSVKFTRSPTGLIGALKKIKSDTKTMRVPKAVSSLFIANPLKRVSGLFQTHPEIDDRIRVLEAM